MFLEFLACLSNYYDMSGQELHSGISHNQLFGNRRSQVRDFILNVYFVFYF